MFTIAFEGLEGSGKSTSAGLFSAMLINEYSSLALAAKGADKPEVGIDVGIIATCSTSPLGTAVRDTLRGMGQIGAVKLDHKEQALLVLSDRLINDKYVVSHYKANNNPYVYDRYIDSTLFLQGFMHAGSLGVHQTLTYAKSISPSLVAAADVTICLECPIEVIKSRLSAKKENARDADTLNKLTLYHTRFTQYNDLRSKIDFKNPQGQSTHFVRIVDHTLDTAQLMTQLASIFAKSIYAIKSGSATKEKAKAMFDDGIKAFNQINGLRS